MSQTSQAGQTVRFPRAERRGLLLGLSLPQLLLTGAALPLLALAAFTGVGPIPGTSLALTTGLLLTSSFARAEGQPAYRWLLLRGRALHRRTIRQDRFRARPERQRPTGLLALPGTAASLKVVESASSGFAAVHDPHARTLTAVLRVHGTAFALLDTGEQDRRVRGWGRVLAGLCQGGRIARVQVMERSVPDSGDALVAYAQRHLSDPDTWQAQVYQDLVGSA